MTQMHLPSMMEYDRWLVEKWRCRLIIFLMIRQVFRNASKHVDPNLVAFQAVMKYIEEMETIYPRPPSVHEQSNQNNVNIDKI